MLNYTYTILCKYFIPLTNIKLHSPPATDSHPPWILAQDINELLSRTRQLTLAWIRNIKNKIKNKLSNYLPRDGDLNIGQYLSFFHTFGDFLGVNSGVAS